MRVTVRLKTESLVAATKAEGSGITPQMQRHPKTDAYQAGDPEWEARYGDLG